MTNPAEFFEQLTVMANMVDGGVNISDNPGLTRADALTWFERNLTYLQEIVASGAEGGWHHDAAEIGRRVFPYLLSQREWPALAELADVVAQAALAVGDAEGRRYALQLRGIALQRTGQWARARDVFRTVAESAEHPQDRAQAVAHLGQIARRDGDLPEAARLLSEAILLYRQAGSVTGEATTLNDLADVQRDLGAAEEISAARHEALELFTRAGHAEGMAMTLRMIASDHGAGGRMPEAEAALRKAARMFAERGIRKDAQECYSSLAAALRRQRRYPEAREVIRELRDLAGGPEGETEAGILTTVTDIQEAADQILQARTDQERDEAVSRWPLLLDPELSTVVPESWRVIEGIAGPGVRPGITAAKAYLRQRLVGDWDQALQALWRALRDLAARDGRRLPEQIREHADRYRTAANRDTRIGALLAALPLVPPEAGLVQAWFHRALAHEYLLSMSGPRSAALEASIRHGEHALALITREADPQDWMATHADLAVAYRQRLSGDPAANADTAITHWRHVLTVVRRGDSAERWAGVMTSLANAYAHASGERSANLRRALARHQAALRVLSEHDDPEQWAAVCCNIGLALTNDVFAGDPQNREQAIAYLTRASRVRSAAPTVLALTELNLALCYGYRVRGDGQENSDAAVRHAREAYRRFEELGDTVNMARSAHMLANALARRPDRPEGEDLEEAISWYQRARTLSGPQEASLLWAGATDELACYYAERLLHGSEDNWELAIELHNEAIDIYARHGEELDLSRARYNLAHTLRARGRAGDLARAAEMLDLALQGPLEAAAPMHWADVTVLLAKVQLDRSPSPGTLEAVASALRRVVHVLGESSPERTRLACTVLGQVEAGRDRWPEAAEAFLSALASAEHRYRASLLRSGKERSLAASAELATSAGYALVRAGRPADAAVALERGRARLLGDRLDRDRADLARVQEQHPAAFAAFEDAAARLRLLESRQLQPLDPDGASAAGRDPAAGRQLRAAIVEVQGQLEAATAEIRRLPGATGFLDQPGWDAVAGAVQTGEMLAYLTTTDYGSAVVAVLPGGRAPVSARCPLSWTELRKALSDVAAAATSAAPSPNSMDAVLDLLGCKLIRPLAEILESAAVTRVHLVATGPLGRLPLHAARFPDSSGQTACLADRFDVSYAPSARLLARARAAAAGISSAVLAGVGNPLPNPRPLPFSEQELACVSAMFPAGSSQARYGEAADRAALLEMLPGATYVHLACHGGWNPRSPMASRLELGGGDTLTLADLLGGDVFTGARLVVASACQSAVIDLRTPDETLSLPTAFMQAGAAAVVGTLWPVPDVSCALLMTRFYQLHLLGDRDAGAAPMSPARALACAQRWLRTRTASELADVLQGWPTPSGHAGAEGRDSVALSAVIADQATRFRLSDPERRPYAAPQHWAPYVLVGI